MIFQVSLSKDKFAILIEGVLWDQLRTADREYMVQWSAAEHHRIWYIFMGRNYRCVWVNNELHSKLHNEVIVKSLSVYSYW